MRRFIRSLTIAFMCGILIVPAVDAQNRRDSRSSNRTENTNSGRRASSGSKNSSNTQNKNSQRENKQNNGRSTKPSRPNNGKVENKGNVASKSNHGSGRRVEPGRKAPQTPNYGAPRHNRPPKVAPQAPSHGVPPRHYHRPVPPPTFRPHRGCPVIHGILGLTFGTAINLSLDYLYGRGYVVNSYSNDVVYLRNVSEMSFLWPEANLYYGTNGLIGSQFIYSTGHHDCTRYNQIYSTFVTRYGAPVNYQAINGGYLATWFGYDNGYISLEFKSVYGAGGHMRYYTTLSFGL